jgi:hypothetical protein
VTANGKLSGPAVATGTLPQGSCLYLRPVLRERERHGIPPGTPEAHEAILRVQRMQAGGAKRPFTLTRKDAE